MLCCMMRLRSRYLRSGRKNQSYAIHLADGELESNAQRYTSGRFALILHRQSTDSSMMSFRIGSHVLRVAVVSHRWWSDGDVLHDTRRRHSSSCQYQTVRLRALHLSVHYILTRSDCFSGKFSASTFWADVRQHKATLFQYIGEVCEINLMCQCLRGLTLVSDR